MAEAVPSSNPDSGGRRVPSGPASGRKQRGGEKRKRSEVGAGIDLEDSSDDEVLHSLWMKENLTLQGKGTGSGKGGRGGDGAHWEWGSGRAYNNDWSDWTSRRGTWDRPGCKVYFMNCPPGLDIHHVRAHYEAMGLPWYSLKAADWVEGRNESGQAYILTVWASESCALKAYTAPPPKHLGKSPKVQYGGHKGVNVRWLHEKLGAMKARRQQMTAKVHNKLWAEGKTISPMPWKAKLLRAHPVIKDFRSAIITTDVLAEEVAAFHERHGIEVEGQAVQPILTFDGVDFGHEVMVALKSMYEQPTPIQSLAWPVLLQGCDCIGVAETGCGKTLAFMLPAILHMNAQARPRAEEGPTTLVLVPTRELGLQINEHFGPLALEAGMRTAIFYGQGSFIEQAREFLQGVDAVVATPGRVIDLLEAEIITFKRVTYLVLDEADHMISMGFAKQTKAIVAQTRPDRQTALFCATWESSIQWLENDLTREPVKLTINKVAHKAANKNVEQQVVICHDIEAKKKELVKILMSLPPSMESSRTLIFAQEKQVVEALYEVLCTEFDKVMRLHGDMMQDQRMAALRRFRQEPHGVLVATELGSRGLDIKGLVCVVNFDMPYNIDTYINSIGRTGRAGEHGIAYSLFEPSRDFAIVPELTRCIEESGQEPPLDLYKYYHQKDRKKKQQQQQDTGAPPLEVDGSPESNVDEPEPKRRRKKKKKKHQMPEPQQGAE
eukprot:GGOE01001523.1.p1 GENE.GGOE01001523.1~~GGOE01001523.1.p1  ORF type:complete len:760 (-),score=222.20 GGOE01001523.1:285-2447(-)